MTVRQYTEVIATYTYVQPRQPSYAFDDCSITSRHVPFGQMITTSCQCGGPQAFAECCLPFLTGAAIPDTAEQLMRSRYVAYATARIDYLVSTHDPATRSTTLRQDATAWAQAAQFTRLQIHTVSAGQAQDEHGYVNFTAHFNEDGRADVVNENSRFRRIKGLWRYVSAARVTGNAKVGRNAPCPCQSGKKFKRCCGQ